MRKLIALTWLLSVSLGYANLRNLDDASLLENIGVSEDVDGERVRSVAEVIGNTNLDDAMREMAIIYARRHPNGEYVDVLIESIGMHTQRGSELATPFGRHPSVSALIAVGKSASPKILDAIMMNEGDRKRRYNLMWTLREIEGRKEMIDLIKIHLNGELSQRQRLLLEDTLAWLNLSGDIEAYKEYKKTSEELDKKLKEIDRLKEPNTELSSRLSKVTSGSVEPDDHVSGTTADQHASSAWIWSALGIMGLAGLFFWLSRR